MSDSDQRIPKRIDDADAAFMTGVLRRSGALSANNEVVAQEERESA